MTSCQPLQYNTGRLSDRLLFRRLRGIRCEPPPGLSPVIRGTLVDQVVKQMVGYIVANGLQPEDRLPSERVMRELLGVGRSSMREAIIALSAVGAKGDRTADGLVAPAGGQDWGEREGATGSEPSVILPG